MDLKDAVEYLRDFVKLNSDKDVRGYETAIENGGMLLLTSTVMDIHSDVVLN